MYFPWSTVYAVIAIISFFTTGLEALWTNFELGPLHAMNGTGSVMEFNVKSKRVSRTTFGITGNITVNDVNFESYEAELKWYLSAKGNDEYVLIPMKIKRGPLCSCINDQYRKYVMRELCSSSDMPCSDAEDICPLFVKKTYVIKDYLFASDNISSYLHTGWYKLHILIYDKNDTLVSGLQWTFHLY